MHRKKEIRVCDHKQRLSQVIHHDNHLLETERNIHRCRWFFLFERGITKNCQRKHEAHDQENYRMLAFTILQLPILILLAREVRAALQILDHILWLGIAQSCYSSTTIIIQPPKDPPKTGRSPGNRGSATRDRGPGTRDRGPRTRDWGPGTS